MSYQENNSIESVSSWRRWLIFREQREIAPGTLALLVNAYNTKCVLVKRVTPTINKENKLGFWDKPISIANEKADEKTIVIVIQDINNYDDKDKSLPKYCLVLSGDAGYFLVRKADIEPLSSADDINFISAKIKTEVHKKRAETIIEQLDKEAEKIDKILTQNLEAQGVTLIWADKSCTEESKENKEEVAQNLATAIPVAKNGQQKKLFHILQTMMRPFQILRKHFKNSWKLRKRTKATIKIWQR